MAKKKKRACSNITNSLFLFARGMLTNRDIHAADSSLHAEGYPTVRWISNALAARLTGDDGAFACVRWSDSIPWPSFGLAAVALTHASHVRIRLTSPAHPPAQSILIPTTNSTGQR